jgi:hypothetical protein
MLIIDEFRETILKDIEKIEDIFVKENIMIDLENFLMQVEKMIKNA